MSKGASLSLLFFGEGRSYPSRANFWCVIFVESSLGAFWHRAVWFPHDHLFWWSWKVFKLSPRHPAWPSFHWRYEHKIFVAPFARRWPDAKDVFFWGVSPKSEGCKLKMAMSGWGRIFNWAYEKNLSFFFFQLLMNWWTHVASLPESWTDGMMSGSVKHFM